MSTTTLQTEVTIIGAGPAGLFAAFQLGLLEVNCQIIETLSQAGGQTTALYPDKTIYDIPAIKACTPIELTKSLLDQIAPFETKIHYNQLVTQIEKTKNEEEYIITTNKNLKIKTKIIIIAAGAGAFMPRKLNIKSLTPLEEKQVFYNQLPDNINNKDITIYGGDEAAVEFAIKQAKKQNKITLIYRREQINASEEKLKELQTLINQNKIMRITAQIQNTITNQENKLTGLKLLDNNSEEQEIKTETLIIFNGLIPKIKEIENWEIDIIKKHLPVNISTMQTSRENIFAIGDIASYEGRRKLIACGFYEAIMAAQQAQKIIYKNNPPPYQYTSSSTRLQNLLNKKAT